MYEIKFDHVRAYKQTNIFNGAVEHSNEREQYCNSFMISGPYKAGDSKNTPNLELNGRPAKLAMYAHLDPQTDKFTLEKRLWVDGFSLARLFGDKDKFEQKTLLEGEYTFEQAKEKLKVFEKECKGSPYYLWEEKSACWIDNHYSYAKELVLDKQAAKKQKQLQDTLHKSRLMSR